MCEFFVLSITKMTTSKRMKNITASNAKNRMEIDIKTITYVFIPLYMLLIWWNEII